MDFSNLKEILVSFGYTVQEFNTKEEAAKYLDEKIDQKTVGFGGSESLREMYLYEMLEKHNQIFWHNRTPEGKTPNQVRMEERNAQIYICSVNGLAETGEIVNIDGACNRVADISFGHEQVYMVIGENKITPDLDQAIYRARNIAAPLNAKRLNRKTPCAIKADKCYNCDSPDRICNELSVLWRKPGGHPVELILVHENLGY